MRKVAVWILGLMFILTGAIIFTSSKDSQLDSKDDIPAVTEVSYNDIKKDDVYLVEDLVIAKAYKKDTGNDIYYLVAMFCDEDDKIVTVNMTVNSDSDLWKDVKNFVKDGEVFGDLVLDCYVEMQAFPESVAGLRNQYQRSVKNIDTGSITFVYQLFLDAKYICDADEDPLEFLSGVNTVGMVAGGCAILVGLLIIIFGALHKSAPKAKASAAAAPAAYQEPPAAYQPPVQYQEPPAAYQPPVQYQEPPAAYQPLVQYQEPPAAYQPPVQYQEPPAAYQSPVQYQEPPIPYQAPQSQYIHPAQAPLVPQAPVTQQTPTAQQASQNGDPIREQLDRLKALMDAGYLTQEEFDQKRRQILGL